MDVGSIARTRTTESGSLLPRIFTGLKGYHVQYCTDVRMELDAVALTEGWLRKWVSTDLEVLR